MNIQKIMSRVAQETNRPNSYAFLPEIQETLQAMSQVLDGPRDQREQLARGLERYVLEDFSFSESELGGELLEFGEDFIGNQQ